MYGNVWKWAGEFRTTEKNIGVDPVKINVSLKQLNEDGLFWISNNTYTADEMAIRYKHAIVNIHCFVNGNGRHSRLIADLIINKIYSKPVFSWGRLNPGNKNIARGNYLQALKEADKGRIKSLIDFAKS